uniref:Nucleotide-diphospho-sugar transferase domain-containing protein n=1 Tax=Panagrolaimus sp. PS1159 TaxID=55785 RepID=A0AC35G539_9BILA
MNRCANEDFPLEDLMNSKTLWEKVNSLRQPFGIVMLNKHVVDMTLNWLCNTATMEGVHERILFFTLDQEAADALLKFYPTLRIFTLKAKCLQGSFKPLDATYMSFFLLRTNLIRALLLMKKSFWMLQADTFWRQNLFANKEYELNDLQINVALDQQGYSEISQTRKRQMNGANFLVIGQHASTLELFDQLHWYQTHFYVTDPDAMKIVCAKKGFHCNFIDHSIISGWEWIYGSQSKPPQLIQMDGETSGGKVEMLKQYHLWFLDDNNQCIPTTVSYAKNLAAKNQVPKFYSNSKLKQKLLLSIGDLLNNIPLIGRLYRIYGGIPSLYLQIF